MEFEKKRKWKKVAVLYSPWFWAWWSTRCYNDQKQALIFDSRIVDMVLNKQEMTDEIMESLWYKDVYIWWYEDLKVSWLDEWTKFYIDEYDGSESIETDESLVLTA